MKLNPFDLIKGATLKDLIEFGLLVSIEYLLNPNVVSLITSYLYLNKILDPEAQYNLKNNL